MSNSSDLNFIRTEPNLSIIRSWIKEKGSRMLRRSPSRRSPSQLRGRFSNLKEIGRGGFGTVQSAFDNERSRNVALKTVRGRSNIHSELHEVNILKNFHSDYIAKIFDFWQRSESLVISMELCSGGDLFSTLSKYTHFPESIVCQIMFDVLSGLSYAHSRRIAHLDLKLENIVLSRPWDGIPHNFPPVKIIDWGLSATFDNFPDHATGSVLYMAPEVIRGDFNHKADLWSIGVVMYSLVAGVFPFDSDSQRELVRQIMRSDPSYSEVEWSSMSDESLRFILSVLTRMIIARPEAESLLEDTWFSQSLRTCAGKIIPSRSFRRIPNETILPRLGRYAHYGKFRKYVLNVLTPINVENKEIRQLSATFGLLADNTDKVRCEVIKNEIMKLANEQGNLDMLKECTLIDFPVGATVNVHEFIFALLAPLYNTRIRLHNFFDAQRVTEDGDEGSYLFTQERLSKMFGDKDGPRIFSELDGNSNGKIELKEFVDWMLKDNF